MIPSAFIKKGADDDETSHTGFRIDGRPRQPTERLQTRAVRPSTPRLAVHTALGVCRPRAGCGDTQWPPLWGLWWSCLCPSLLKAPSLGGLTEELGAVVEGAGGDDVLVTVFGEDDVAADPRVATDTTGKRLAGRA